MEPAPKALVERFKALMDRYPEVEQRQMFGYPCAFANGQMVTGLFAASWMVRLPEEDRQRILEQEGAHLFEPMPGRPMREYVVVPPAMVDDTAALAPWIERSLAYVATLPPKPAKAPKARKTRSATTT